MEQLEQLYEDVKKEILNGIPGDRRIYVVLSPPNAIKIPTTPFGKLLITFLNKLQKAADIEKRSDYPHLILVQYSKDVPQNAYNVVHWNNSVFNENSTLKMDVITKIFDDCKVYKPFKRMNGKLTNLYGPEQQFFDFNPDNHEKRHEEFRNSIEKITNNKSDRFSEFQATIHAVMYCQYCRHCLTIILDNMKNVLHVRTFVNNLSRRVWSPIEEKMMVLCNYWTNDEDEKYKYNCWRLNKKAQHKLPPTEVETDRKNSISDRPSSSNVEEITSTSRNKPATCRSSAGSIAQWKEDVIHDHLKGLQDDIEIIGKETNHAKMKQSEEQMKILEKQATRAMHCLNKNKKIDVEIGKFGFKTGYPQLDNTLEEVVSRMYEKNNSLILDFKKVIREAGPEAHDIIKKSNDPNIEIHIINKISEKIRTVFEETLDNTVDVSSSNSASEESNSEESENDEVGRQEAPKTRKRYRRRAVIDSDDSEYESQEKVVKRVPTDPIVLEENEQKEDSIVINISTLPSLSDDKNDNEVEQDSEEEDDDYRKVEEPPREEMFRAYLIVEKELRTHIESLPLSRKEDDFFCVFCFNFYASDRHNCPGVDEAEKLVNRELNDHLKGVMKFNRSLCKKLIAFANKKANRLDEKKVIKPPATVNPVPASLRMTRRIGKSKKAPPKANPQRMAKRTGKPTNAEQEENKANESTSSSSSKDSSDESISSQSGQSSSPTDKEKEPYRTKYGRSVKRVIEDKPPALEPAPKRKRTKKDNEIDLEQPAKPISHTSDKRRNKLIKYALDAGLRLPENNVPFNLPADKSQWTREDYKKDTYGPVYVAIQNFVPDYLREENMELLDDGYQSPVEEDESEDDESDDDESDDSSVAEKENVDESGASQDSSNDTVSPQESNNDFESTSQSDYSQDSSIDAARRNEESSDQSSSAQNSNEVSQQHEIPEFNNSFNHVPMDDEEPSDSDPKEKEYITVNDDDDDDDDDIQIIEVVCNVEPTEKQKEIEEINKREAKRAKGREIMLASHPDDQHTDGKKNCTLQ